MRTIAYIIVSLRYLVNASSSPLEVSYFQDAPEFPRVVAKIIQPSGRVIEVFSLGFFGLDQDAQDRYRIQSRQDAENDKYTPRVNATMTEKTPLSDDDIILGDLVHVGYYSTVYRIEGHPDLLIKYEVHCTSLDTDIHPLLRDAWYSNETSIHKIAPRVRFVSPPSLLCDKMEGKCHFQLSEDLFGQCKKDFGTFRYMIMERIKGASLHTMRLHAYADREGAMPFARAMAIGANLINLVRKLHLDAKIIHGDIHGPNIMVSSKQVNGSIQWELNLIDFEMASKIRPGGYLERPVRSRGFLNHALYTHWQYDGFEWAQRDDVLKAIQTVAHIMHPGIYLDVEHEICSLGPLSLRNWKCYTNWFIPTADADPLSPLTIAKEQKDLIRAKLGEILRIARNLAINQPVPYETIMKLMFDCAILAKGQRVNSNMVSSNTTTQIPSS